MLCNVIITIDYIPVVISDMRTNKIAPKGGILCHVLDRIAVGVDHFILWRKNWRCVLRIGWRTWRRDSGVYLSDSADITAHRCHADYLGCRLISFCPSNIRWARFSRIHCRTDPAEISATHHCPRSLGHLFVHLFSRYWTCNLQSASGDSRSGKVLQGSTRTPNFDCGYRIPAGHNRISHLRSDGRHGRIHGTTRHQYGNIDPDLCSGNSDRRCSGSNFSLSKGCGAGK